MTTAKGTDTRETILKTAFDLAGKLGLEAISIGELAKKVGMSKSGLFGHFHSKEKLQVMVIDFAADRFSNSVIRPALKKARGIPRIEGFLENWIEWSAHELPGGCPFIAAAVEYDDRLGPVRDRVAFHLQAMLSTFQKAAELTILEKQFKTPLDTEKFAFQFYAIMLSYQIHARLLNHERAKQLLRNSFEDLISQAKA